MRFVRNCLIGCMVIFASVTIVIAETYNKGPSIEQELTEEELSHWAFQPIQHPRPPEVQNESEVANALDRFILARLEEKGLSLMPSADRRTLIRRLSFGLRGLPPTQEEIQEFLNDDSEIAYEVLVDRFLGETAFGERWGQHWLDVVRFAETEGFEHDYVRPDAWRYRDWVIHAFNKDIPYDEFVSLQIAGDELYPDVPDMAIGTGFLVAGPDMSDINIAEERSHTILNEMTSATGAAFLGLTMACAQCHDHKFDAISQADFYRMRAVFANMYFPEKQKRLNQVFFEPDAEAPATHLMLRGMFNSPGPVLAPGFVRAANPMGLTVPETEEDATTTGRRKALAKWITDPEHPLATRVIMNRVWHYLIGIPIVGTPNDFGVKGDRPTHPQLLDWLSKELMVRNWSLKEMIRLVVMSATYRQVSRPVDDTWVDAVAADPDNRLLSRMPRKRLEGEAIRDAMLFVSGRLNRKQGGPGVHPPLPREVAITLLKKQWEVSKDESDHYRRSIYLFVRRNLRFPMFDVFDRPDTLASCGRRNVSTTAPQSLTLLNSDFSLNSARHLAGEVLDSGAIDYSAWVDQCYERLFSRLPSDSEREIAIEFLEGQTTMLKDAEREVSELAVPLGTENTMDRFQGSALTDLCLALFNLNEMIYID